MSLPAELVAELRVKFHRYSVSLVDEAERQFHLSGFRVLLKSCPSTALSDVPEERIEALFLGVAGPGSTKRGRLVGFISTQQRARFGRTRRAGVLA